MDIKILENLLQVTIDRGNLRNRHYLVIQKRTTVNLGLLKSGKVELRRTIDQGNLSKTSWDMMQQVVPHREEPLLDGNAHSVRYGETIHDGSGKPETLNHQEEADSENFVMGSDAAEFVNKVKDQVRSRQKRMSNVAESGEEHSIIWGMFMAATMNAATFMGKNFSTIQSFVKNYEDLTLKQMFDVTAQLVNDQEEPLDHEVHALFAPIVQPHDVATTEESWVRGAESEEMWVVRIHGQCGCVPGGRNTRKV